jgi:DeoR/GlpR family transcriptional regulator of sugar metabolism
MLKKERHIYILDKVQSEGRALVSELTKELEVKEDTIRKDMQELSGKGLIKRVHGGALSIVNDKVDFTTRIDQNAHIKEELVKLAVPVLEKADVLFIDGGTTNLKLAEKLPHSYKGKVLTNSPSVAFALSNHPHVQIYVIGGEFDKASHVNTGSYAIKEIERIHVELCVLGISSIDSNLGITVPLFEESLLKSQLIKQSSQILSVVTKEKLEKVSTFFVEKCSALDYIITEKSVPANIIDAYKQNGIEVLQ